MNREEILLGNGAIALGLVEAGCQVVTSYPGTPSSEILPEVIRLVKSEGLDTYVEWSTNEKVALDNAFSIRHREKGGLLHEAGGTQCGGRLPDERCLYGYGWGICDYLL